MFLKFAVLRPDFDEFLGRNGSRNFEKFRIKAGNQAVIFRQFSLVLRQDPLHQKYVFGITSALLHSSTASGFLILSPVLARPNSPRSCSCSPSSRQRSSRMAGSCAGTTPAFVSQNDEMAHLSRII